MPTASFRFHLTMDTLAVQLCASLLPTRTRDFHPLEPAHGGRTREGTAYDLPFPLFALFLLRSLLSFLRLPHHPPHGLPLHIFMKHPGNSLFAVKHQQRAVFLAINLLCPVLRLLLLAGADGLPCFVELHQVKALCLLPKPGILSQGQRPARQNTSVPVLPAVSALLHGGNVFGKFIGSIFPGICSDVRSIFFSERSSSKSSVRAAILAASSRCRNTWTAESAFFSESRLRRSFVLSRMSFAS